MEPNDQDLAIVLKAARSWANHVRAVAGFKGVNKNAKLEAQNEELMERAVIIEDAITNVGAGPLGKSGCRSFNVNDCDCSKLRAQLRESERHRDELWQEVCALRDDLASYQAWDVVSGSAVARLSADQLRNTVKAVVNEDGRLPGFGRPR